VVLIRNATDEDIEDLFSRLNNGEPLNAAEKRNAMGGEMAKLIREIARRPFFNEQLHFSNGRHQHYDLAARILAVEARRGAGEPGLPDVRSAALDTFVRDHRRLTDEQGADLVARVDLRLDRVGGVFGSRDPLLSSPAQVLLDYLFVGDLLEASDEHAVGRMRDFLGWFGRTRLEALDRPEGDRDPAFVEFSDLSQHGTNEKRNIERRLAIVREMHDRWGAERGSATGPPDGNN